MFVTHNEFDLFHSIIKITDKRDKKSLQKTFFEVLSQFVSHEAFVLLRLPRSPESNYLEVIECHPELVLNDKYELLAYDYGEPRIQPDESINRCISSGEFVLDEQDNKTRLLFPILVNNKVVNILDIFGHRLTEKTEIIITGLLRCFTNVLSVIDDNEHDALTGLLNRKTFDAQLGELLASTSSSPKSELSISNERRLEKESSYYWVGVLDIDHFKRINDNFGHMYGDEVLILFSNIMEKSFRSHDLLFRYGGEEFVVVLSPTPTDNVYLAFERFRKEIEAFDFPQIGRVTVSIGVIKIDGQSHQSTILEHADQALYYAKDHGRNQICDYDELIASGQLTERKTESNVEFF